jgi:hypothetical protein
MATGVNRAIRPSDVAPCYRDSATPNCDKWAFRVK